MGQRESPEKPSVSRTPPANVQIEREVYILRLTDVWSSLAERYTGGDIVDIYTGEITVDTGFFRNTRKIEFGAITVPVAGDVSADEGTDEEEDEYDVDELDTFANTTLEMDNVGQNKLESRARPVPPMTTPLGPADAEDLCAFLEAERRRKELCGSEDDEDDYLAPDTQGQSSEVEDESAAEDLAATDASEAYPCSQTAIYVDSASEDELDNWDVDKSSVVYSLPEQEDDSAIEVIDEPGPRLDLAQVLKAKTSTRNHSTSPEKSASTRNALTSSKPYVLLTPRKSADLAKSKTEKQTFNMGKRQNLSPGRKSSQNKSHSEDPPTVVPFQAKSPPQSSMPLKRKRVSSDSGSIPAFETSVVPREEKSNRHFTHRRTSFSDDLPYHETQQASTFYMVPDDKVVKPKSARRSSSQRPRPSSKSKSTVSSSASESGSSSDGEREYSHKHSCSYNNLQSPHPYYYPHHHPSPHRKKQHPPPFTLPIPDPRAQFIITQAMQQLSALVGMPWTPPHDSSIPYTPPRHHQSRQASPVFNTPSFHPHPYPYSYDPNLSLATLPPESPELPSSPEKSLHGPRKSSLTRRSRSRGRRVSFKLDNDESGDDDRSHSVYSSPSNTPSRRWAVREQR